MKRIGISVLQAPGQDGWFQPAAHATGHTLIKSHVLPAKIARMERARPNSSGSLRAGEGTAFSTCRAAPWCMPEHAAKLGQHARLEQGPAQHQSHRLQAGVPQLGVGAQLDCARLIGVGDVIGRTRSAPLHSKPSPASRLLPSWRKSRVADLKEMKTMRMAGPERPGPSAKLSRSSARRPTCVRPRT